MNYQEAVRDITAVRRTCKGPRVFTGSEQEEFFGLIRNASYEDHDVLLAALNKVTGMLNSFLVKRGIAMRLAEAKNELTVDEIVTLLVARLRTCEGDLGLPCGYDVNLILLSHPFDGVSRVESCPKCGNVISFTSPIYELSTV